MNTHKENHCIRSPSLDKTLIYNYAYLTEEKVVPMRMAGIIIILILAGALTFYVFQSRAGFAIPGKLDVEALFACVGLNFDESLQREVEKHREMYVGQGFMALYRECYSMALDSQKFDFPAQFAAVSTIFVIGQYEIDSAALRNSSQRLFINFCRMSLVEKISAVQINKLLSDYRLFADSPEMLELWNDYLQLVWQREVQPRIRRYGNVDENDRRFIKLRENFATEASALLKRHGKSLN